MNRCLGDHIMATAKQLAVRAKFKRAIKSCKGVKKAGRKACFRKFFKKGD